MADLAYVEQRNRMSDSRAQCLASIAAAIGCSVEALPREVVRAVTLHGHECHQAALVYEHEAHERATAPAPPKSGAYRDAPTRVDRPFRRG